jgi:uncharacterized membrane protein YgcG
VTSACRMHRLSLVATLVVIATLSLVSSVGAQEADEGPSPGAVGEPAAPMEIKRVYDFANLLNDDQKASIESDAARLRRFDLPVLIMVQFNELSSGAAEELADEIRREWGVESEAGADDGMVMLVSVNTSEAGGISTVVSWGKDALPNYGVDDMVAASIKAEWLDRHIAEGELFNGILYSLRKLLYHSIYFPAPQEPLTATQQLTGTAISVTGPIIALGSIVLVCWWYAKRSIREMVPRHLTWSVPAMSFGIAVMSVWSRSGWGISAVLVLLVLTAGLWVARDPARALPPRGSGPLGTAGTP